MIHTLKKTSASKSSGSVARFYVIKTEVTVIGLLTQDNSLHSIRHEIVQIMQANLK
jgi:hypothetical protein